MRVLIVEDEANLARGLVFNLQRQGLEADCVESGEIALEQYQSYDLMVLDVGLPGIDGFEVLRRVRVEDERFPVLILTARAAEDDRIEGLSLGADDYITKPFSLKEFLLRVQGKLKQVSWYSGAARQGKIQVGLAVFDFDNQTVRCGDQELKITVREEGLVRYFLDNPDRVVTRQELLQHVWGYSADATSRTPDTFVARLRKIVERDASNPQFIVSVRGKGYKFLQEGLPSDETPDG